MVFISKQLPVTIIINDVSYEHDKLNQCLFCYCCLAEKAMTMKVHELRHIALFVKASAPLWVFSCFPYENANGHLKGLVHGTFDTLPQRFVAQIFVLIYSFFITVSMVERSWVCHIFKIIAAFLLCIFLL